MWRALCLRGAARLGAAAVLVASGGDPNVFGAAASCEQAKEKGRSADDIVRAAKDIWQASERVVFLKSANATHDLLP